MPRNLLVVIQALTSPNCRYVVNQIFAGEGREELLEKIHKHLMQVAEDVRQNLIPIDKYVINKVCEIFDPRNRQNDSPPRMTESDEESGGVCRQKVAASRAGCSANEGKGASGKGWRHDSVCHL